MDSSTRCARLSWRSPPDESVVPSKYYVIKFREEGGRWRWLNTVFVPSRQRWYEVQLPSSGHYRFHVGCLAMCGAGTPAQVECILPDPSETATRRGHGAPASADSAHKANAEPPAGSWKQALDDPAAGGHVVQIYRDPAFQAKAVATWTGAALRDGGGAVLLCMPESAARILPELRREGFDPDALAAAGRLAILDADAVLGRCAKGGTLNVPRFRKEIQAAIAGARAAGAKGVEVRAWGELVSLLWEREDRPMAREVELIWNEIARAEGIRLLCSYRLDNLEHRTHQGLLRELCESHTRLVPEEDYARLDRAVGEAMQEVFGESREAVLSKLQRKGFDVPAQMPAAQRVLMALHEAEPRMGARVLDVTRERFGPLGRN